MSNTPDSAVATEANSGFHDPTSAGFTRSFEGRLLFWIAVLFSTFQIATAAHLFDLPSQENIEEVIIDSGAAKGVSQPVIVHSKNKSKSDKTSAA